MPGMEINLGFGGLSEAVNRLREMERLTAQIARNQTPTPGAGQAAQTGGTSAGPMARQARAQNRLAEAQAGGDAAKIFDAQVQAHRAQQSVDRAQRLLRGTTQRDRLMTAISTSRFGAGGIEPLIGRTAAAIGGEAAAGPLGMIMAGATTAMAAFTQVMNDSTRVVGEFRRGMSTSGGTAGDLARLGAMGVAPGQVGQAAAGLRERLVTDSRAMGAAQRIGLQLPGHRLAGGTNEAEILRNALSLLRVTGRLAGAERQLLEARELGLEGYLDTINVSDRLWSAMMNDARITENIMKTNAATFREFEGSMSRFTTGVDNAKVAVGGVFAPGAGAAAEGASVPVNWAARFINWASPVLERMGPLGAIYTGMQSADIVREKFGLPGGKGPKDATEENTRALEANTQMIEQGMFGGGPRAAGAVPAHLRGQLLAEALQTQKLNLGIFGN